MHVTEHVRSNVIDTNYLSCLERLSEKTKEEECVSLTEVNIFIRDINQETHGMMSLTCHHIIFLRAGRFLLIYTLIYGQNHEVSFSYAVV
jgi:hypothetical protein